MSADDPIERSGSGLHHASLGFVNEVVEWLRLLAEATSVVIITIGLGWSLWRFARMLWRSRPQDYNEVRLLLARYLALGLEFQLAADILSTAIAPTWERIGKLAAIAVIRTGLNFFLMREMEHEQRQLHRDGNKFPGD